MASSVTSGFKITTSESDKALLKAHKIDPTALAKKLEERVQSLYKNAKEKKVGIGYAFQLTNQPTGIVNAITPVPPSSKKCSESSCEQVIKINYIFSFSGPSCEGVAPHLTLTPEDIHQIIRHHNFKSADPLILNKLIVKMGLDIDAFGTAFGCLDDSMKIYKARSGL